MTIPSLSILGNLQPQQGQGATPLAGQPAPGGFSDLFSLFFGSAQSAEDVLSKAVETGNVSTLSDAVLAGLENFDSDRAFSDIVNNNSSAIANTDILALVQELEGVLAELESAGIEPGSISSVEQLAAAYETLGLSATEARTKAQSVDAAIKAVAINNESLQDYLSLASQEVFDNPAVSSEELLSHIKVQQSMAAFSEAIAIQPQGEELVARVKEGLPLVEELVQQVKKDLPLVEGKKPPLNVKTVVERVEQVAVDASGDETAGVIKEVVTTHKDVVVEAAKVVAPPVHTAVKEGQGRVSESKGRDVAKLTIEPQTIYKLQPTNIGLAFNQVAELKLSGDEVLSDAEVLDVEAEIARQAEVRPTATGSKLTHVAAKSNVAQQVQNQIQVLVGKNGGEVKMTLNPQELGEVKIVLDVQDGRVAGKIIVQTPEALEQLARDLRVLQQGLADAGLELDKNGIDFQLSSKQHEGQELADGESAEDAQADDVEEGETAEWKNADKLVDVRV